MTPGFLAQRVAHGRETRNVEFKGPGPRTRNSDLTLKVIRAVLGLANTQDGGHVLLGVDEDATGKPVVKGLTSEDLATWTQDGLGDQVGRFADPRPSFDVLPPVEYEGALVLPIRVEEFEEAPIVCIRDGQTPENRAVLRAGAIYIRSDGKVETREPASHAEMRRLVDLAIKKGLRRFVEQAHAAGMRVGPPAPTDDAQFEEELALLPASDALAAMRAHGSWRFTVRPLVFESDAMPSIPVLEKTVRENAVSLRGWDFPPVLSSLPIERRQRFIFQDYEHGLSSERWTLFTSGQFIHERPLQPWTQRDEAEPPRLLYGDAIYTVTECFELASRLATLEPYRGGLAVVVEASGLDDRQLVDDSFRLRAGPYIARGDDPFEYRWTGTGEDLMAGPRELALAALQQLFVRFHFDTSTDVIRGMQTSLLRG